MLTQSSCSSLVSVVVSRIGRRPLTFRSVDCVTRIHYLLISLLTCRDATHWCAVGGSVERRLAARKRPACLTTSMRTSGNEVDDRRLRKLTGQWRRSRIVGCRPGCCTSLLH